MTYKKVVNVLLLCYRNWFLFFECEGEQQRHKYIGGKWKRDRGKQGKLTTPSDDVEAQRVATTSDQGKETVMDAKKTRARYVALVLTASDQMVG